MLQFEAGGNPHPTFSGCDQASWKRALMSTSDSYSTVVLVAASILLAFCVVNEASAAATQRNVHKKAIKQEQVAPPPQPAPPPPPPTLEQMPSLPPKVSFSNGMLSIEAENSTLGDILRAVRKQTGAGVEIPSNATERVVTHLGPGPARDVLASLLNGSHFNYVMLGSPTEPDRVDRIILTSKSGGTPDTTSAPTAPGQSANAAVPTEESETPGMDIAEQPGDDSAENSAGEESQQPQPNGQPQVKTPEQLLQELQRQQQQLQQQQGSSSPPQPPPDRPPR